MSRFLTLCLVLGWFWSEPSAVTGQSWFKMPSPFTYVCKSGVCIKKERSESTVIQSFNICKIRCGRFRVLWPAPTGDVETSRVTIPFKPGNIRFSSPVAPSERVKELLRQNTKFFLENLKKMHPAFEEGKPDPLSRQYDNIIESTHLTVAIEVEEADDKLGLDTPESYKLEIETQGNHVKIELKAETFFGARHALETLSQLIAYDEIRDSLYIVSSASISDKPIFPYRGVMLDTARNYFTPKSIMRLINAMSYNKLNTLHWHVTDSQSFPFYSHRIPQMTLYGAYTSNKIYFPDQVLDIVEYGRVRGVRIIPELTTPSHVGSGWQWGGKSTTENVAVCMNKEPWNTFCSEPPCGQLNPTMEKTYEMLGKLYRDFLDVFERDFFHMGGNDVDFNCWNSSEVINNFLGRQSKNASSSEYMQLWANFQERAFQELQRANHGRDIIPIVWSSRLMIQRGIEGLLDPEKFIVQIGTNLNDRRLAGVIDRGYRVIFSTPDVWNLECGYMNPQMRSSIERLSGCKTNHNWRDLYKFDLIRNIKSLNVSDPVEPQQGQVLGGEVLMWSDIVDEMSFESKIFPKASAMAERLWSNPSFGSKDAEHRFAFHRARMVERGVRADGIEPEWCFQNQGHCPAH